MLSVGMVSRLQETSEELINFVQLPIVALVLQIDEALEPVRSFPPIQAENLQALWCFDASYVLLSNSQLHFIQPIV